MTKPWEYLSLVWAYEAEKQETPDFSLRLDKIHPVKEEWIYKEEYRIWRAGAEEGELCSSEDGSSPPSFIQILNELGAEGWELVGFEAVRSRIGKAQGWSEVGYPVRRVWMFKRPVETGT